MTVTTTNDQETCKEMLRELEILHLIKPNPPHVSADSIYPLGFNAWLVVNFVRGHYTVHILEGATGKDALEYMDKTREAAGCPKGKPRLIATDPTGNIHN